MQTKLNTHHSTYNCFDNKAFTNMLDVWKKEKAQIYSLISNNSDDLIKNLWSNNSILLYDKKCCVKMGLGDVNSNYACSNCRKFDRFLKLDDNVEQNFTIPCSASLKNYVISKNDISHLNLKEDLESKRRMDNYLTFYPELLSCGTSTNLKKIITGDSFTISHIVHTGVSTIFEKESLPHITPIYTGFVCGSNGCNLISTSGTINSLITKKKYRYENDESILSPSLTYSILKQLVVMYCELKKINFSHGNPIIDNLEFNEEPVSYKYKNVTIISDITLKMKNFETSSATFGNNHYYPESHNPKLWVQTGLFTPKININKTACNNAYYTFDDNDFGVIYTLKHIGFPIFVGSLDLYVFIIDLMRVYEFHYSLMADAQCKKFWDTLWLSSEDNELVLDRILNTNLSSYSILKGIKLKCELTNHLFEFISKKIYE